MMKRELKECMFKAYAENHKTKKMEWYEDVYTDGLAVLFNSPHRGIMPLKGATVVCSTGAMDVRGNMIYDGDILRDDIGKLLVVEWDQKALIWMIRLPAGVALPLEPNWAETSEVVGHILSDRGLLNAE